MCNNKDTSTMSNNGVNAFSIQCIIQLDLIYDLQTWSMQFFVRWELPMEFETKEALSAVLFIKIRWLLCVPNIIY